MDLVLWVRLRPTDRVVLNKILSHLLYSLGQQRLVLKLARKIFHHQIFYKIPNNYLHSSMDSSSTSKVLLLNQAVLSYSDQHHLASITRCHLIARRLSLISRKHCWNYSGTRISKSWLIHRSKKFH